ncbi:MAG TPA: DUF2905 domain-containing protein [Longimicrobium sp.]|jgi:hypothetical protein|uniref:DUF2905 domain-containing protein n=1 Tax=Longimicrobium sp. TaxID=2029185 RepID=UPI002ED89D63
MHDRSVGLLIVGLGAAIVIVGLLVMTGALGWVGRLPGDIRIESGSTRVYFPIVTMIVVSVVLSLLLAVARRFF